MRRLLAIEHERYRVPTERFSVWVGAEYDQGGSFSQQNHGEGARDIFHMACF